MIDRISKAGVAYLRRAVPNIGAILSEVAAGSFGTLWCNAIRLRIQNFKSFSDSDWGELSEKFMVLVG